MSQRQSSTPYIVAEILDVIQVEFWSHVYVGSRAIRRSQCICCSILGFWETEIADFDLLDVCRDLKTEDQLENGFLLIFPLQWVLLNQDILRFDIPMNVAFHNAVFPRLLRMQISQAPPDFQRNFLFLHRCQDRSLFVRFRVAESRQIGAVVVASVFLEKFHHKKPSVFVVQNAFETVKIFDHIFVVQNPKIAKYLAIMQSIICSPALDTPRQNLVAIFISKPRGRDPFPMRLSLSRPAIQYVGLNPHVHVGMQNFSD